MPRWLAPALLAAILATGGSAAAGQLGALGPPGDESETSVAAGYFFDSNEMNPRTAGAPGITINQNKVGVTVSRSDFGYTQGWGGYFSLGAADIDDGKDFTAGYKPFARGGIKGMPLRTSWVGAGLVLDAGVHSNYEARTTLPGGDAGTARFRNLWNVRLGLGLQASVGKVLVLYGGPLFHYARADVKLESPSQGVKTFVKYRTTDGVGAFGGVRLLLPGGFSIAVEGQHRGVASAGADLAYSF